MVKLKIAASLLIFFGLIFVSIKPVEASLVIVTKEGDVTVNVLAEKDSTVLEIPIGESLEVKEVAETDVEKGARVALVKDENKIQLSISTATGDKNLDITNYKDDVIEIEQRPEIQKVAIAVEGGKFMIKQKGIVAETEYQINVDPKTASLTLTTPSGLRFLSILPRVAADSVLRTKLINRIPYDEVLNIIEGEDRELAYLVTGDKVINVFNAFEYSISVTTKISASTGEMLSIEEPSWLQFLGFLFT